MANVQLLSLTQECFKSSTCLSNMSALALCTLPIILLCYFVIQNLILHPLAKYPGPFLGRLTPLYDLYHAYIGDKHLVLYHLHQKYGRVVRFTPNTISINDPAALKVIYANSANVRKADFYKYFRAAPDAISTLLATEKAHHARKRRIMGQAFADSAMKGLETYVLAHADSFMEKIGEDVRRRDGKKDKWSKALDLQAWCNWLVFDVMGDTVFGKPFGVLGDYPENRKGIFLLTQAARRNYAVAAMPSLIHTGLEKWIPPFSGLFRDRAEYLAFSKQQLASKMERADENRPEDAGRKDIFNVLLHAEDPETGEGVPMPELFMDAATLIVAGSDTTSTTLAATLFYILQSPAVLTRLEKEIRDTFSRADDIRTGPQMQSCTWLRACIDEAMRMSPAVPGLLPREILPGGLRIPALDMNLPPGINVGVTTYAIHHHSDYVVNPFTYDPSRWLSDWHLQDKAALQSIYTPFSHGHRSCLGKPLVYMELSIAIARLVFEYDMRLAADQRLEGFVRKEIESGERHKDEYHMQDWFLSNNFGPFVEFRARERDGDGEEKVDSAVEDCE